VDYPCGKIVTWVINDQQNRHVVKCQIFCCEGSRNKDLGYSAPRRASSTAPQISRDPHI